MSRRIVLGLAVLFLAAPVYATASAQASTDGSTSLGATASNSTTDTPIEADKYNACTNEWIHFVAMEHVTRLLITDGTRTRFMYRINFSDAHGTGATSGAKYVLGATEREVDISDGAAGSQVFMVNEELIGQGQTPNVALHLLQTFSWDGAHVSVGTNSISTTCD